jgi:hypothetical protein
MSSAAFRPTWTPDQLLQVRAPQRTSEGARMQSSLPRQPRRKLRTASHRLLQASMRVWFVRNLELTVADDDPAPSLSDDYR